MNPTSLSLLEQLADRTNSEAWRRMHDLYSLLIRGWLQRYSLSDADRDDISQTVLAAIAANFPHFQHNGRVGAFRTWLKTITINAVRQKFRVDRVRAAACGGTAFLASLNELEDPQSSLSEVWDRSHDMHVARTLMSWAEQDFEPATWIAFRRQALDGAAPAAVAAELGMTINAVLVAKSRVLKRLRELGNGLIG
jgi:RNA polymerase sigma-70 factor (ECF subfamily)